KRNGAKNMTKSYSWLRSYTHQPIVPPTPPASPKTKLSKAGASGILTLLALGGLMTADGALLVTRRKKNLMRPI
nr:hypothetical protein [Streptococcus anginosus]